LAKWLLSLRFAGSPARNVATFANQVVGMAWESMVLWLRFSSFLIDSVGLLLNHLFFFFPGNRYASLSMMTCVIGTTLGMAAGAILHASMDVDDLQRYACVCHDAVMCFWEDFTKLVPMLMCIRLVLFC
jgi:hypothetical protein